VGVRHPGSFVWTWHDSFIWTWHDPFIWTWHDSFARETWLDHMNNHMYLCHIHRSDVFISQDCSLICHETCPIDHMYSCHIYESHHSSIICIDVAFMNDIDHQSYVFMPHLSIRRICVTRHARSIMCMYITFIHDMDHQSWGMYLCHERRDSNTCIYVTLMNDMDHRSHVIVSRETWLDHWDAIIWSMSRHKSDINHSCVFICTIHVRDMTQMTCATWHDSLS